MGPNLSFQLALRVKLIYICIYKYCDMNIYIYIYVGVRPLKLMWILCIG